MIMMVATTATNAVIVMEGDSVESCGKPVFTKKNWASKGWVTVGDIANSAGRIFLWGRRAMLPELRRPSPLPIKRLTASRSPQPSRTPA
jgi:hypothetical protein